MWNTAALSHFHNSCSTHKFPTHSIYFVFNIYLWWIGVFAALSPLEAIGSFGVRNFMLCKKAPMVKTAVGDEKQTMPRKGNCNWKAWFNKSLSLKISSH